MKSSLEYDREFRNNKDRKKENLTKFVYEDECQNKTRANEKHTERNTVKGK